MHIDEHFLRRVCLKTAIQFKIFEYTDQYVDMDYCSSTQSQKSKKKLRVDANSNMFSLSALY